jgi:acetolactate synthase-1/2/3 large subunit
MGVRGADLVVDALAAAGVTRLFSLSGNQILPIYDATVGRGIEIVHTRHEAAAVHMADAWGRLTEQPGVALVTAGPGHLNALSALYGALMAESPVVLLSGASPLAQAGRGAFQEVDQVAAARPVTKAAWLATDAARLGEDVARALALARSGRPGPVHVSLPGDLLETRVDRARGPANAAPIDEPQLDPSSLAQTLDMLATATRPLILLGPAMARGRRRAAVRRFGEITGIPALAMESPRGTNDPWLHGAAALLGEADLVVLLGKTLDFAVKFGEPPAFAISCRFIQIDADAGALLGSGRSALAIHAEPGLAIERLGVAASGRRGWPHADWGAEVARARRAWPSGWEETSQSSRWPMHPLRVCAAVQPYLEQGAILVADGGEFGQWAQAGLEAETRLINGPSGSIGSALPMALAARLAEPGRQVLALLGDGTFGFHALELDTALRHRLAVVALVGSDARWNAEHQLQLRHYGVHRTVGCELLPSRYDLVAQALGGHGEHVERPEELEGALARAVASGLPACVNVVIDGVAAPTYATRGH